MIKSFFSNNSCVLCNIGYPAIECDDSLKECYLKSFSFWEMINSIEIENSSVLSKRVAPCDFPDIGSVIKKHGGWILSLIKNTVIAHKLSFENAIFISKEFNDELSLTFFNVLQHYLFNFYKKDLIKIPNSLFEKKELNKFEREAMENISARLSNQVVVLISDKLITGKSINTTIDLLKSIDIHISLAITIINFNPCESFEIPLKSIYKIQLQ